MRDIEQRLFSYMDDNADRLYQALLDILRIQSENFVTYGNERPCAEYMDKLWQALSLQTQMYTPADIPQMHDHPDYLKGRSSDDRPNVTAVLPGTDSNRRLMLLAHTDTMPIGDLSQWSVDPLGEMKDGRIYGRGANDNKFGLASLTFIAQAFKDLSINLASDVLFTAYSDEEYGGGNGALAACLKYPCDSYINLDGGNMELWTIALGGQALELEVTSKEQLDSSEPIADALHIAKNLLAPFGARRRSELNENPAYRNTDMQRSAFRITGFTAGHFGCDLNFGKLQFSVYTDRSAEQIKKELDEIHADIKKAIAPLNVETSGGFKPMSRFFHYAETQDSTGLIASFKRAGRLAETELAQAGSCLTDLNLILKYGSKSSINFGLVRDFKLYGGAHQPDEFVDCEQLLKYTKILAAFLMDWCGTQNQ